MLAIDYPSEIVHSLIRQIDKKEEEPVDFDEFLAAVKNLMIYDGFFEEAEQLFKYLDIKKEGKVDKKRLF